MSWLIWMLVPIVYGLFCLWYFNWKGPVSQDEIDEFVDKFAELETNKRTEPNVIRSFLEEDDGNDQVIVQVTAK